MRRFAGPNQYKITTMNALRVIRLGASCLVSLFLFTTASAQNQEGATLVGSWQMEVELDRHMHRVPHKKEMVDTLEASYRDYLLKEMQKKASQNQMEFMADYSYQLRLGEGLILKGTWQYDPYNREILLKASDGHVESVRVKSINNRRILLKTQDGTLTLTALR